MQLQNKSSMSQCSSWLLVLKQKPSNKMTDDDLHQQLNMVHITKIHTQGDYRTLTVTVNINIHLFSTTLTVMI